jgi:hypothetical protein
MKINYPLLVYSAINFINNIYVKVIFIDADHKNVIIP